MLGRRVDWRLLPPLTGLPEPAVLAGVRTAVEHDLLRANGASDDQRFSPALVRDAVLKRLLPLQRASLARTAAQLVEELGEDLELATALHEQAGGPSRAGQLLAAAAVQAGGALGTRERLLRRAADLMPHDDDVVLALVEVLLRRGAWSRRVSSVTRSSPGSTPRTSGRRARH